MEVAQSVVMANDIKRGRDVVNCSRSMQTKKKRKTGEDEQIVGDKIEESAATENNNDSNDDNGPLQLDDINNDCLRHIFEYLSMHELIKVAELSKQFVFAAAEAFSRRYRKKQIEVMVTSEPDYKCFRFGYLRMNGAVAMTGLEHFGARMSTLSANFLAYRSIDPAQRHPIDVAILQKCTNSLQTFEINCCIESHFEMIEKPFAKVENLTIAGSTLGVKIAQLNRWFPNLMNLKLSGVEFMQPNLIETRFEHLTALHIVNDADAKIPERTIHQMLHFNRQLKSLRLRCDYGTEMLLAIMDNLTELETLELWIPTDRFASYTAKQKISLNTLKTLILHAAPDIAVVDKMPFTLKNVNRLRLYGFYQYHPLIVELIESGHQLNAIDLVPFQKQQLPLAYDYEAFKQALMTRRDLNELELCVDEFVGDDLRRFIEQCKQVNVLRLMTTNLNIFQTLQLRNDDWSLPEPGVKIQFVDLEIHNSGIHFQMFYQLVLKRNE